MTAGTRVRAALAEAVKVIIANVPPCPDRSTAIRKTRDECNQELYRRGWRLDKGRTLCRQCEGREKSARDAKERRPK